MRINNNISALNAWNNLTVTDSAMGKNLEKLSSGFRINRAADDAAGLAISEKMRGQIRGLNQAVRNAQDGISLIQTAEGALTETHSILQRMRELTVQSANATNTDGDRKQLQSEMDQLAKEMNRISNTTQFNQKDLLKGTFTGSFQIGANTNQAITVSVSAMDASALGVAISGQTTETATGLDISTTGLTSGQFDAVVSSIDAAIEKVSTERAKLGAFQNRLEHTINNLNVAAENLTASESRIRDVDMAKEMTVFTKNQILTQAGTAMLAQANQKSQSVLSLLR